MDLIGPRKWIVATTCEEAPHFQYSVRMMFIPRSVMMRSKGYVLDKALKCRKFGESNWVPKGTTVADRKKAYRAKIDRTVDVLSKFVTKAVRAHRAKKVYAKLMIAYYNQRANNARFQWNTPNWGDYMVEKEEEEMKQMLSLPEAKWRALMRSKIAEHKEANQDILPLLRWQQYMDEERAKYAAARKQKAELDAVWQEMSLEKIGVPVKLHNKQTPAKKRVIRQNAFAALDSDDDVDMEELERLLRGV